MSIFSLTFIILCFLCMHACNARHLLFHHRLPSEHFSIKAVESVNVGSDPVQINVKNGSKAEEPKGLSKEIEVNEKGENSGVNPTKSFVSVTHKYYKKRDEHPEFYSDYSRPRTRPPSHN